jgi:hypothetical protein
MQDILSIGKIPESLEGKDLLVEVKSAILNYPTRAQNPSYKKFFR